MTRFPALLPSRLSVRLPLRLPDPLVRIQPARPAPRFPRRHLSSESARAGPVCPPSARSCKLLMMRLSVRFSVVFATLGVLALALAPHAAQGQNQAQSSSTAAQVPSTPTYVVLDPLANVHYDNRYDLSVGAAYRHMKAGPTLLQGSNLGGLDVSGSYWFCQRWAARGLSAAPTSAPAVPAAIQHSGQLIKGPFVAQYFLRRRPGVARTPQQARRPHRPCAVRRCLRPASRRTSAASSPSVVDFYNNQLAPAAIIGGHIDLNRSAHWVFRITPDAIITHYGINYGPTLTQSDVNFAISVGVEYKFKKKR